MTRLDLIHPNWRRRAVVPALAGLGWLAGISGASAQYFDRPVVYGAPYYRDYGIIRPPARVPSRAFGAAAYREFGLARVDRLVRTEGSVVVDGRDGDGRRLRLIFDAYGGGLIDTVPLEPRPGQKPRVARSSPPEERPVPRSVRPPERPRAVAPTPSTPPPRATLPRRDDKPAPALVPTPPAEANAPAAAPLLPNPAVVPSPPSEPAPAPAAPVTPTVEAARPVPAPERPPTPTFPPATLDEFVPKLPDVPTPQVPVAPLD